MTHRPSTHPGTARPDIAGTTVLDPKATHGLERLLSAMQERQEQLLTLAGEHRAAISAADAGKVGEVVGKTRTLLEEVASLDAERCRLLGVGAPKLGEVGPGVKLSDIASRAPEPARTRLMDQASTLKKLMERVRAEHAALRAASESMVQHMRGLMQQVAASLSHAKTYSASGRVECTGSPVVTGIDISS